jgi:hypothetical protein
LLIFKRILLSEIQSLRIFNFPQVTDKNFQMIIIILILSNYYASKMIIKLWYYYPTDVVIPTDYSLIWILNIMLYLYVYICLWMYWITNIMISMYMYLAMLFPINALIWLYATTAYHVYWNVSDNRVICHICIPYHILNFFRLSCFSTIRIYPFIYSNLSDNHVICIAVFCSKCYWLESQTGQARVPQSFFFLYCGRTLQESDVLTLA